MDYREKEMDVSNMDAIASDDFNHTYCYSLVTLSG